MNRRIFCLATAALASYISAGSLEAANEMALPTPLIGDFRSQMALEEWKIRMRQAGIKWQIVENQVVEAKGERPRFSNIRIAVNDYPDFGKKGNAQFQFFNEKLMAVRYFPNDFAAYQSRVWSENQAQTIQKEILVKPSTRIYSAHDFRGMQFVCFEDIVLTQAMNQWIARYS